MVVINTAEDAHALAQRHARAFRNDKLRSIATRKAVLRKIYDMMIENREQFIDALAKDLGKPRSEALLADIGFVENEITHVIANIDDWAKPQYPDVPLVNKFDGCHIVSEPFGTILIIAPWNYPVQLTLGPLVGAIAGGNTVCLKPSELSTNVSAVIDELVPKYLDPDMVSCVCGAVKETSLLLEQKWDHIFYTGSTQVGKIVMEKAAKHLTPVTLELGGKSPCIIDKTADLKVAAHRIMWGKCMNAGQTCIAPDYIICEDSIQPKLIEEMQKTLQEFYGNDVQQTKDFGRIINERHFDRLSTLLQGQKVAVGGTTDRDNLFIEPTILKDVSPESAIMTQEIFGPLLPLISSASLDNTIEFINDRDKPLALYMFSNNKTAIDKVMNHTSAGGVCINDTIMHAACPGLPFGGVGPSGIGAYHGKATWDCFTHKKPIMHKSLGMEMVNNVRYPPFSAKKTNQLMGLLFSKPDWTGSKKVQRKVMKLGVLLLLASAVAYATKSLFA